MLNESRRLRFIQDCIAETDQQIEAPLFDACLHCFKTNIVAMDIREYQCAYDLFSD